MSTVTEKLITNFVNRAKNIFDVYLCLYLFMKKREATVFSNYRGENKELFRKIRIEFNSLLLEKDFASNLTQKCRTEIIKVFRKYQFNLMALFALYYEIDSVFGQDEFEFSKIPPEDFGERVVETKPLNSKITWKHGLVHYKATSFINRLLVDFNRFPRPRLHNQKGSTLEREQKNLLVYIPNHLTDYEVQVTKVKCNYVLDKIAHKEALTIALVPFTGLKIEEFLVVENVGSEFIIAGIKNEDIFSDKVLETMHNLGQEGVDIVVFPEMTFTTRMIQRLQQYLRDNINTFVFVVCGSVWEDKSNCCIVLNGNGHILSRQYKNNLFPISTEWDKEGNNEFLQIDSQNRIIKVLDIEKIGRVSTPICVDFITQDNYKELAKIGVNVCFVPAFSKNITDFQRNAEDLGSHNHGSVFNANCCSEVAAESKLLFYYIPIKGEFEIEIDNMVTKTTIKGTCITACKNKTKCIELPQCSWIVSFGKNYCKTKRVCYN